MSLYLPSHDLPAFAWVHRAADPVTPTDQDDPIPAEEDETAIGAWQDERPEEPVYEPVPEVA